MSSVSLSDTHIIDQVLSGHRDSFAVLLERYLPIARAVALARMRNADDADDVAQEAMLQAYTKLGTLKNTQRFGAWLTSITRNIALSVLRRQSRHTAYTSSVRPETVLEPDITQRELYTRVRTYVDELPTEQRECVLLRYFAGQKLREIASLLNVTTNAVEKRLVRARVSLGERILDELIPKDSQNSDATDLSRLMGLVALAPPPWEALGVTASVSTSVANTIVGGVIMTKKVAVGITVCVAIFLGIWAASSVQQAEPLPSIPTVISEVDEATSEERMPAAPAETLPEEILPEEPAPAPTPEEIFVVTEEATGSVEGTVLYSNGDPAPGVRIRIQSDKQFEAVDVPDSGRFSISGLRAGHYSLSAGQGGFITDYPGGLELKPGENVTGIAFVWDVGWSISGRVTNQDSEPLEGISLSPFYRLNDGTFGTLTATTDETGRYFVQGFPAVKGYRVIFQVRDPLYVRTSRYITMPYSGELDLVLAERPRILGVVLDASTGDPITRFRLNTWIGKNNADEDAYTHGFLSRRLENHASGKFELMPDGFNSVNFAVSSPGYAPGVVHLENLAAGDSREGLEILLKPIGPIGGIVVNVEGEPISDTSIYLTPPMLMDRGITAMMPYTKTNSNGEFFIPEYTELLSTIYVYHEDYAPVPMDFDIEAAQLSPIRITLGHGGRLEGVVTFGDSLLGDGRADVNVHLGLRQWSGQMMTQTRDFGAYSRDGLRPGEVLVMAGFHEGGIRRYIHRLVTILDNETVYEDFHFDDTFDSGVEGFVLVDGEPSEVTHVRAAVSFSNGDTIHYQTETLSDGSYSLQGIPAATFEFGFTQVLNSDQSYFDIEEALLTTLPGEILRHDILIETEE